MNKITLTLLILLIGQISFGQVIPVAPKPKEAIPKVAAPGPSKPKKSKRTPKANIEPQMLSVQGGSFSMGSNESSEEKPIHTVTVSSFKMSKYEVTVAQYRAYCNATGSSMPDAPSWGWKETHPIVNVNYDDAYGYCNWLSEKTGKDYRLPTEAEWEFAARGGKKSNYYTYAGSDDIDAIAWYADNSEDETHAVGGKRPNELGLYDMTGNVSEWCSDWYDADYYSNSPSTNPRGPSAGRRRVLRGGSWSFPATTSHVPFRYYDDPQFHRFASKGFRVVSP